MWIKIEPGCELPKPFSSVLLYGIFETDYNGVLSSKKEITSGSYLGKRYNGEEHWSVHFRNACEPTHWMPLPDAPNSEKGGE